MASYWKKKSNEIYVSYRWPKQARNNPQYFTKLTFKMMIHRYKNLAQLQVAILIQPTPAPSELYRNEAFGLYNKN